MVRPFGNAALTPTLRRDGVLRPAAFDAYLAREGVDVALVLSEYSPKVDRHPARRGPAAARGARTRTGCRPVANINPHLHYPRRRASSSASSTSARSRSSCIRCTRGFAANDRALYPAYEVCQVARRARGRALRHEHLPRLRQRVRRPGPARRRCCATSASLTVVLAHGGRGWWYDAAAFLALSTAERLDRAVRPAAVAACRTYYARHDCARLTAGG